jgi:cytochrome c556
MSVAKITTVVHKCVPSDCADELWPQLQDFREEAAVHCYHMNKLGRAVEQTFNIA